MTMGATRFKGVIKMTFLPSDYKEPDTGKYMKLQQGENTFRVLSEAITGMEYWKEIKDGRRPIRLHPNQPVPMADLELDEEGNPKMPKHFWAFVVYNRNSETVQILEITQSTIRRAMMSLYNNKKWGEPKDSDIRITRSGEGFDTEYTVMPEPKEGLDEGILVIYKDMGINLEALYDGKDPFAGEDSEKIADEVDQGLTQQTAAR